MDVTRTRRPTLNELHLSVGKRARLRRLLYEHGVGNGTIVILPIDQGLEHGPRDFFANPDALNPEFQIRLAVEGKFSGIAFHVGLAQQYLYPWAGQVPLILKLNGKTEIPSDKAAFSPLVATVEDAVRLGADAVGYTLYIGSPAQADDFRQFQQVRSEAERYGMPTIVWAYPRGEAIETKGGRDGLYAIDYAARVANELGADIVKVNLPKIDLEKAKLSPKPYNTLDLSQAEAAAKVVKSAGKSLVLFSGGEMVDDQDLLAKATMAMEAGATGLIFGRNIWQRPHDQALEISLRIRDIMKRFSAEDG